MSRRSLALLVTDRQLAPAWTGNRVRILGLIRSLRELGLRVALVTNPYESLNELSSSINGVIAVRAPAFSGGSLSDFDVAPFQRATARAARRLRPRLVVAEYAWMAPALAAVPRGVARWVDCHDVLHERCARFTAAGLDRWTVCTADEEIERLQFADVVIAAQDRDAELLGRLLPHKRVVSLLPAIRGPRAVGRVAPQGRTVLTVGSAQPGNDLAREFAREAWPRVLERVPDARLRLVGAVGDGLPPIPGVEAPGQVAELEAEYERAAAVVCPVAVGTGVKVKVLEALRLGCPTVATPAAVEGLPRAERPAWVEAPTAAACADAVADLLLDRGAAVALARAARAYGDRHLAPRASTERLRTLLAGGAPAPRARSVSSISIVVPSLAWNAVLERCLASLRKQEPAEDVEIVVVLNGSDRTACADPGPRVRVIHEPRQGPAAARNAGVRLARGDALAFVDSDCVALPGWLEAGLAALRATPGAVVAGAIVRPGADRNAVSLYDSVTYLQQERYVRGPRAFVTANLLVHRLAFERVGPFDDGFEEAAFEDWEWALRARAAGVPVVYEPAAAVEHPCMHSLAELRRKTERLARGRVVMGRKMGDAATRPALPAAVWAHVARALREERVPRTDRLLLAGVGSLVGYWSWSEAHRERRRPTAPVDDAG
jgi:GT2 family glycosyltransferase/glycosyltransferase involved in cell wall biosynthesis